MKIPLYEFYNYINEKTLFRGLSFYQKDKVLDLFEIRNENRWEAMLDCEETSLVSFTIEEDYITGCSCECNDDRNHICVHFVAALFYMESDFNLSIFIDFNTQEAEFDYDNVPINELLNVIPHTELIEFVKKECKHKPLLKEQFLNSFWKYIHSI